MILSPIQGHDNFIFSIQPNKTTTSSYNDDDMTRCDDVTFFEVSPSCSVFFLLSLALFSSAYLFFSRRSVSARNVLCSFQKEKNFLIQRLSDNMSGVMKTMRCPVIIIILSGRRF